MDSEGSLLGTHTLQALQVGQLQLPFLASTRTSAPIAPQALEQLVAMEQRQPSPVSALNGANQRLQTFITRLDEVFLHLHLHIRAGEQMVQSSAIAQELSRDGGDE